MMVSIREATANAIAFAQDALGSERTRGVRLEEVESTSVDGLDAWLITLSMILPASLDPERHIPSFFKGEKREYKSFTVLKNNGEVKSMKIRELADA
ncbi:MAG TPA: hypothetical protein VML01_09405 [Bryobacterales bacterium]|nr:hypothetical protein [Bryobacterales bacterium]